MDCTAQADKRSVPSRDSKERAYRKQQRHHLFWMGCPTQNILEQHPTVYSRQQDEAAVCYVEGGGSHIGRLTTYELVSYQGLIKSYN